MIRISEAQVTALVKVEAALTSLKEAIERIGKQKSRTSPYPRNPLSV